MRKGLQSMWNTTNKSKTIKLNNEDFECIPDGECWCKEEVDEHGKSTFPQLPASSSKDICYSPEEIERLKDSQTP